MDDEYQVMMRQALGIALLIYFGLLLSLAGCTGVKVDKLVDIPADISPQKSCPKLAMPPVPEDLVLDISGDKITANAGGEELLRYYSRARQLLR